MHNRVGLLRSKLKRMGADNDARLASENAVLWLGVRMNSFFILKSRRRGASVSAIVAVLADS